MKDGDKRCAYPRNLAGSALPPLDGEGGREAAGWGVGAVMGRETLMGAERVLRPSITRAPTRHSLRECHPPHRGEGALILLKYGDTRGAYPRPPRHNPPAPQHPRTFFTQSIRRHFTRPHTPRMKTTADIPLPSGLRRLVDDLMGVVRAGVRRFWRGGDNVPVGETMTLLTRLTRILRCAFVLFAVHLEIAPARVRAKRARGAQCKGPRPSRFALFPRYRITWDDTPKALQPQAFAAHTRDRVLALRRKLDALTRALADPMTYIRRMARRLSTQLMVFGWRPPRRPPPVALRDYWEELLHGYGEARHALGNWRRRTTVIAAAASGS